MNQKLRTPQSFVSASWRGTLPVDRDGSQGISFNTDAGVVRLRLDAASVVHVRETLAADNFVKAMRDYEMSSAGSQSDASEGSPSAPRSVPSDGISVCPPEASSTAC